MEIRAAHSEDAESACVILRHSITELCDQDHCGDPAMMTAWLANKTAENMRRWIEQSHVFVATEGPAILGVGAITGTGKITLNYVSPDARLRGVSRAILAQLEEHAADRGIKTIVLHSTATAHRFYLSAGYTDNGESTKACGVAFCYPMIKQISAKRLRVNP
jgi:GNAT superfamily N-acetyltransferase